VEGCVVTVALVREEVSVVLGRVAQGQEVQGWE
jgi:hypothetical protein